MVWSTVCSAACFHVATHVECDADGGEEAADDCTRVDEEGDDGLALLLCERAQRREVVSAPMAVWLCVRACRCTLISVLKAVAQNVAVYF